MVKLKQNKIQITDFEKRFAALSRYFPNGPDGFAIDTEKALASALGIDQSNISRRKQEGWSPTQLRGLMEVTATDELVWVCDIDKLQEHINAGAHTWRSPWNELIAALTPAKREDLSLVIASDVRAQYFVSLSRSILTIMPDTRFRIRFAGSNQFRYALILGLSPSGWRSLCPSQVRESTLWDSTQNDATFPADSVELFTGNETGPHEIVIAQSREAFPQSITRQLRDQSILQTALSPVTLNALRQYFPAADKKMSSRRLLRLPYMVESVSR